MNKTPSFKTRTFSRDTLLEILYGDSEEGAVVLDEISGTSRWSVHHHLVFDFEGKLYSTTYSVGATEQQDERPWEYDGDQIECTQMRTIQRLTTDYEAIPSDETD